MIEVDNVKNEPSLRDILNFWTWQRQKRSNSAILPHFSKLTTSKTKQFCETSFKNGKLSAERTASYQCVLRFFRSICLNYCACHEKVMPGHTKCCTCQGKIISANLKIWCSKMQPLSGNQRPDLLTALMNMSLVLRLPRKMHLCRSSSNVPRLPSFVEMLQNPHVLHTFEKVHNPLRLPRETTSEPPKVAQTCGALYILTSKCASRHHGVHFFDISTSKSGPNLVCFVRSDFEMCFAPQRRCTFSTSQLPKVVRSWYVLYIFTSKCAWRHNGVHFFNISTSKSGPRMVFCTFWLRNVLHAAATTACNCSSLIWPDGSTPAALASLLFDLPEPQIIGKTQCFATFLPFLASASSFFWLFLFSDLLSSTLLFSLPLPYSAFHLSILSEVWLLNFLR